MTTKLQYLQQQVAAHMAAKKERELAYAEYVETGLLTIRFRKADDRYNSQADAAMTLLSDLLVLLEANVVWLDINGEYEVSDIEIAIDTMESEIKKLLTEYE